MREARTLGRARGNLTLYLEEHFFFTQETHPTNYTKELYHIGYRTFDDFITERGLVRGGLNLNRKTKRLFHTRRFETYKHLKDDHDGACARRRFRIL